MSVTTGGPSVAFVKQYKDTIYLLAQQTESRLSPTIMVDNNFRGEQKFYDQYNTDDMVEIMSEYADTPVQTPAHARRMVAPRFFVSNTLEDPFDALQMLIDPKSTYMQAKVASANRKKDDVIIAALGATAYIGKVGTTTQALTLTQASASAGLTKTKCVQAKKDLDAGEVEKTDRYLVHSASQLADLLMTTEVTSSDYNVVKALVEGELNTWLGFQFIHSERLATNASSERLCYAYQRMGAVLAIQKDIVGRVDERADKNYAWQVYLKVCMGATRLEEARVEQLACTETF
jgi:hypothetical protein